MQYLQKKIGWLMGLLILSSGFIALLYQFSRKAEQKSNGFRRNFYPHPIGIPASIDLPGPDYYFAGLRGNNIIMGRFNQPEIVLIVDTNLLQTANQAIEMPAGLVPDRQASNLLVQDSSLYLLDGYTPHILSGNASIMKIHHDWKDSLYFNLAIPLTDSSYVLRIYNNPLKQNILVKLNPADSLQHNKQFTLNKQVDGVFCTSGQLQYLPLLHTIVYTYFFQNQFVLLDTHLQKLASVHTIDTNTMAKIKVSYSSKNTRSLASPDFFSNRLAYASGNHMFIYSGVRAENDDPSLYDQSSVMDIYSLSERRYLFSLYIPDAAGKKINAFIVSGTSLYALQGNQLTRYPLQLHLIDQ